MTFTIHNQSTAPEKSNTILGNLEQRLGFIPNILGVLAESPFALQSVEAINHAAETSNLTPIEQRIVTICSSMENQCKYCVPAQSTMAVMADISDDTLDALRKHQSLSDSRLEALRQFTVNIIQNKGWIPENQLTDFLKQGFELAQVLDVITLISLMTLTNYVNHIANLPLDDAFIPQQWAPDQT